MNTSLSRQTFGTTCHGTSRQKQPSLDDVLNKKTSYPYTLDNFKIYLSKKHCTETLDFIFDVCRYQESYHMLSKRFDRQPISSSCPEAQGLLDLWLQLLSTYILPGSPRQINSFSEERQRLLKYHNPENPPPPATLDLIAQEMHELLSESVFVSFLNEFTETTCLTAHEENTTHRSGHSRILRLLFNGNFRSWNSNSGL